MTSSLVGSARVEITGDLAAFAERTQTELEAMFGRWDAMFASEFASVTASFGGAGAEAGTTFATALTDPVIAGAQTAATGAAAAMAEGGVEIEAAGAETGVATGAALVEGATGAVRAGAPELAASTSASVSEAGAAGATRFREMGAVAGERFTEGAKEGMLAGKEALLIGVGALGFAEVAKSAIENADQLEGANFKIEHIFGESSAQVRQWAASLEGSFGISKAAAESLAGSFGQMLSPLGLGAEQTATMSERLATLTQDVAKFNNADPAAVQQAIIAGLRGRATALRQYGIVLSSSAVKQEAMREGLLKAGGTLSDAAKTQASYNLIMEQTKRQQGAVGDASSTLAQRQKVLGAQWTNMTADLGMRLMPMLANVEDFFIHDIVPALETTGHWINENRSWLGPLIVTLGAALLAYKLTGVAITAYGAITRGVAAVLGVFSGTSDEAAAAQARLAGAETAASQAALDLAAAQAAADEAVAAGGPETAATAAATANLARASTAAAAADTELAAAQTEVGVTSKGAGMSMGGLVGTMAAVGVGGYFLGRALNNLVEKNNLAAHALDHLSDIEKSFAQTLEASSGKMDANARAAVGVQLQSDGMAARAAKANVSLKQLVTGLTGGEAGFRALWASMKAGGASGDTIVTLALLRSEFVKGRKDAADLASVNDTKVKPALTGTAAAARATAAAERANATSVKALNAANEALINTLLSAAQSQDGFDEAVRNASSSIKGNSHSLSRNSADGLANRDALLSAVQAALSLKDAQDKAGGSTAAHTQKLASNITSLRNAAIAAGADKGQVDNLLSSLHAMPSQIRTAIHVDSKTAAYNIAFIKQQIADLPTYKQITIGVNQVNVGKGSSTYNSQVPGGNAEGTNFWRGGLTWVGEHGRELLDLPQGSRITPNYRSEALAASLAAPAPAAGADGETVALLREVSRKLDALGMLGHLSELPRLPDRFADSLDTVSRGAAARGRTAPAGSSWL